MLPVEIFKQYQQNKIDIESAIQFLQTYIEGSDDENLRLEALELLGKLDLKNAMILDFLENSLISDSNKRIRLGALKIILNKFFLESNQAILHVIAHERSADILYFLYKTLEEMNTDLSKHLISLMEEKLAYKRTRLPLTKYYMEFDLVPREAFALRLLYLETKSGIFDSIHSFDSPCVSVKIENQHVVALSIFEVKFPEIKFLDLFSELRFLTINFANLKEIKNLESLDKLTFLNLSCNNIRKLEGLDGLINLEDLMVESNPIEKIEGLDNLKKLRDLGCGDTKISSEDYKTFINSSIPSLIKLAGYYLQKGEYQESINKCQRILELDENEPIAYYYLGLNFYETKRFRSSIKYFKKARKIDKSNKLIWFRLGISYFALRKNMLARFSFLKALNLESKDLNNEEIHLYLGLIWNRYNIYNQALKESLKAIKINPSLSKSYDHAGFYYYKLNNYEEAIACYRTALKLHSIDKNSNYYLGVCLKKIGKIEEAKAIFKQLLKFNTNYSSARINLGLLSLEQDDPKEALKHFKRAAIIKNLDMYECKSLAEKFYELDEPVLALNLINRALNIKSNNKPCRKLKKKIELEKKLKIKR